MYWRIARGALISAEWLWTAALFAAVYVASRAHGGVGGAFASVDYAAASFLCHQRPERSFHLWGAQLPVCARCAGLYVGAAIAALFPIRARLRRAGLWLFVAVAPAVVTLIYEWTTGVTPSNWIRAATGAIAGVAVMIVLLGELRGE